MTRESADRSRGASRARSPCPSSARSSTSRFVCAMRPACVNARRAPCSPAEDLRCPSPSTRRSPRLPGAAGRAAHGLGQPGGADDEGGRLLRQLAVEAGFAVVDEALLREEPAALRAHVAALAGSGHGRRRARHGWHGPRAARPHARGRRRAVRASARGLRRAVSRAVLRGDRRRGHALARRRGRRGRRARVLDAGLARGRSARHAAAHRARARARRGPAAARDAPGSHADGTDQIRRRRRQSARGRLTIIMATALAPDGAAASSGRSSIGSDA